MFGIDRNEQTIGVAPLSIYYLFKLIEDLKSRLNRKVIVKMLAFEVIGSQEKCFDLLNKNKQFYLNESNSIISSSSAHRCDNLEKAFEYFDIAINARCSKIS